MNVLNQNSSALNPGCGCGFGKKRGKRSSRFGKKRGKRSFGKIGALSQVMGNTQPYDMSIFQGYVGNSGPQQAYQVEASPPSLRSNFYNNIGPMGMYGDGSMPADKNFMEPSRMMPSDMPDMTVTSMPSSFGRRKSFRRFGKSRFGKSRFGKHTRSKRTKKSKKSRKH